ncbi:MAG TPA: MFS transporter, partial [Herminiimonas sp.]|nr:MFS transporter [Herminiimonas sp.]
MNEATCAECPNSQYAASLAELPCAETAKAGDTNWAGIGSLALGVFGLVTAEFLPASLLTAMSADLGVS